MDPGGSSARSVHQRKLYEWLADGGFRVDASGAQTEEFFLAEGHINANGVIYVKLDASGHPVIDFERSTLSSITMAEPSAEGAVDAMGSIVQLSIAQTESAGRRIDHLMSLIGPLLTRQSSAGVSPDVSEALAAMRQEIAELRARLPPTTQPASGPPPPNTRQWGDGIAFFPVPE
jgi:hypothetical protein